MYLGLLFTFDQNTFDQNFGFASDFDLIQANCQLRLQLVIGKGKPKQSEKWFPKIVNKISISGKLELTDFLTSNATDRARGWSPVCKFNRD